MMLPKALLAVLPADLKRYLTIKQMSDGTGHPENVPAAGATAYGRPRKKAADGTGDFDSASRGGPAG
jgi:hypothetical protein